MNTNRKLSDKELESLPYGLWRRHEQVTRAELDPVERLSRDQDEAWEMRHPEEADRLDAMIDRTVRLRRTLGSMPDPETGEGRGYPKGSRFRVAGRVRGRLLIGTADLPCPIIVKPEWVEVV